MSRHDYTDEASWRRAWAEGSSRVGPKGAARYADMEAIHAAAHFVGETMLIHGFRLFHNGGLPLLVRRAGYLLEEIVFEPGPQSCRGMYVPLHVRIHVSHEGVRELREKYWREPNRVPPIIATGSLGLLDSPPVWVVWDVASGGVVLEELARWVTDLAVPWLDAIEQPETLHPSFTAKHGNLLKASDALELILSELGREPARRFLREIIEFGGDVSRYQEPLKRVDENASLNSKLNAIATSYRLR